MSVDPKEVIARRVAREIHSGTLVNLGIGLPTLVASFLPRGLGGLLPGRERHDRPRVRGRPKAWRTPTSPTPAAAS